MPKPGSKPEKEFRATYNKFRANFQCNLSDLSDILYISLSNDENLREIMRHSPRDADAMDRYDVRMAAVGQPLQHHLSALLHRD